MKTYSRYTKDKREGNQSIPLWKSSFWKEGSKRGRTGQGKGTLKLPGNNKIALVSPYLSKVDLNVDKFSNQKIQSG